MGFNSGFKGLTIPYACVACTGTAVLFYFHSAGSLTICNSNKSPTKCNNFCSLLTFIYSSTCFERPHVHHQELNNCSSSLWFYHWSAVVAVVLVVVGPVGPARPQPTALLSPLSNGKTRCCYCSC